MRIFVCLCAVLTAWCHEGGVGAESGETLFAEGAVVSLTYLRSEETEIYDGSRRESNPEGLEERTDLFILSIQYGLDANNTVGIIVPYQDIEEEDDAVAGLADVSLYWKRRVYFDSTDTWAITCAAIGGLQLPTGRTDEEDGTGARLDPELQPGSGSVDLFAGGAVTYEWDRLFVSGFTLLQRNNRGARDFKHGDIFTLGCSIGWRPIMESYPGPTVVLQTGLTWEHEFASMDGSHRDAGSGGDLLYWVAKVAFSPRAGWRIYAGLDLPVVRSSNGPELMPDYRFTIGVSHAY